MLVIPQFPVQTFVLTVIVMLVGAVPLLPTGITPGAAPPPGYPKVHSV